MSLFGMYNMNMFGTSGFTGMFSGGLTSFGGFGNFGSFGMGGNVFTNCFGEVNYDAMAGYGVANALTSVAGMAINQAVNNKRSAKAEHENNQAEIAKINQEINSKTSAKNDLNTENTSLQTEVDTASAKSKELAGQISNKEADITNLQAEYDRLTSAAASDETKKEAQTQALKNLNTAKEELKKLEADKAEQDKIVQDKTAEIEANNAKIEKLNNEISQLEAQKAQLQDSVNDVALDNADGSKWKRTSKEDFDKKWKPDGTATENTEFTKSDLRYAIAGFRAATTPEEKREWAKKFETIYENLSVSDRSNDFIAAKKIIDNYAE